MFTAKQLLFKLVITSFLTSCANMTTFTATSYWLPVVQHVAAYYGENDATCRAALHSVTV